MGKENGESESEERTRDQKMGLFSMSVFKMDNSDARPLIRK